MIKELLSKMELSEENVNLILNQIEQEYKPLQEYNEIENQLQGYKTKEEEEVKQEKTNFAKSLFNEIGIINDDIIGFLMKTVNLDNITKNEEGNYSYSDIEGFKEEFKPFISEITVSGAESNKPPVIDNSEVDTFLQGFNKPY